MGVGRAEREKSIFAESAFPVRLRALVLGWGDVSVLMVLSKQNRELKIIHTLQNGARPRIAILAPLLAESALVARALSQGRAAGGSRA